MGRTNAVKEKEGLWEVHEQLLSKSAALQARLREADDSKSRLQELNVECAVLKDKLQVVDLYYVFVLPGESIIVLQ